MTTRGATRHFWNALVALAVTCLSQGASGIIDPQDRSSQGDQELALPASVSFNAHIRPIMSNTCFACHGPDDNANTSGIRLDSFAAAVDEGGVINPGQAEESRVYRRLMDPDDPMPPADFRHQLTDYQKALFRKWIEQGATYQQHWAYTPLTRPNVPPVNGIAERVANPIDAFVLQRLQVQGVQPTPLADKATLLRRLSLDLIGVPPSPAELARFLSDTATDAYERQVERLLESPRYGERMASRWLDIVRFSDTVGFHGDQNQRIFPYRDYVIDSINRNQPFDEFTREQLAGDLLDQPTDRQLVATGLIRLNMMTREGGAQPGEYLAKYKADRVRMIGTAWLGATTGCCECHNHKYDPFTIRDFYSLGAFFDDVQQWGVYHDYGYTPNPDLRGFSNDHPFPPELRIASESLIREIQYLERQGEAAAAAAVNADPPPATGEEVDQWLSLLQSYFARNGDRWQSLQAVTVTCRFPESVQTTADDVIRFPDPPVSNQQYQLALRTPFPVWVRSLKMEVLPTPGLGGRVGRDTDGGFSAALSVTHQERVDRPASDPIRQLPVAPRFVRIESAGRKTLSLAEVELFIAGSDNEQPVNIAGTGTVTQSSVDQDGVASRAIDGDTSAEDSENSVTLTRHENNPWWELDLGKQHNLAAIAIWNGKDLKDRYRRQDLRVSLLDSDRRPLLTKETELTDAVLTWQVPATVSELDLLPPLSIVRAQADRFSTNQYSNGYPSPFLGDRWVSGPGRWQLPADEAKQPHTAVYHLDQPILLKPEDRLSIQLDSQDVGRLRFSISPVSRFVVSEQALTDGLSSELAALRSTGLSPLAGGSTGPGQLVLEGQRPALAAAWYQQRTPLDQQSPSVQRFSQAIAECRSGWALSLVSQPLATERIPISRVLPRGDWQNGSGAEVVPNTPHFLPGYQAQPPGRLSRLDLAKWLTSPENPLTARHYVNRTWKHFFGSGLSNVLDDLGNQGGWPSHPQLLDWLAWQFQQDWDRKQISRLIVTSTTYRQQAAVRRDLVQRDPYNRWLAQQSPRRLEAEAIRDNALAIAGLLLDDWTGGPSIFPFQPAGYYANLQFPNRRYLDQQDGRQYRRGVYMHWQRTFLHPMLANFDAPSRDECTADRTTSNSPQQALTLLNDPVFVEASRALAARLCRERPQGSFAERVQLAFLLALSRAPEPQELNSLERLYESQQSYFTANPQAAAEYQETGAYPIETEDVVSQAALAQVCRVILNLHETITRY